MFLNGDVHSAWWFYLKLSTVLWRSPGLLQRPCAGIIGSSISSQISMGIKHEMIPLCHHLSKFVRSSKRACDWSRSKSNCGFKLLSGRVIWKQYSWEYSLGLLNMCLNSNLFFPEHHPGELANISIGAVKSGKPSYVLGKEVFLMLVTAS